MSDTANIMQVREHRPQQRPQDQSQMTSTLALLLPQLPRAPYSTNLAPIHRKLPNHWKQKFFS